MHGWSCYNNMHSHEILTVCECAYRVCTIIPSTTEYTVHALTYYYESIHSAQMFYYHARAIQIKRNATCV